MMLRETDKRIIEINNYLDRCKKLQSLIPEMEKSKTISFALVREDVGGVEFRCWYGKYLDVEKDAPVFNYELISQHLGCLHEDACLMFGASNSTTLHMRSRHLDTHIRLL